MTDNERRHEPMTPRRRTGAVLLVVVFLVAFAALLVGGLLHALASDLQIVNNDLTSTQALYVADAGIEDAIAALRADYTWAAGFAQKAFPAGSSSHYTVAVANTHPTVVLTSTGVVSGYQRKVEVEIAISETSPPYPVLVVYWKELLE
jgi:cytochrome c biogenesis factor